MWAINAILYISLLYHQQTHTFIFIFFPVMHYALQRVFLDFTFHASLSV